MSIKKNKLNEAARNTGDFLSNYLGSSISQKPAEQSIQNETKKTTPITVESKEIANTAPQTAPRPKQKQQKSTEGKRKTHKLYGVWIDKNTLSQWKAYIDTKRISSEELLMCAVNHYIEHEFPITPEEQEEYEENLKYERELIKKNARGKRL